MLKENLSDSKKSAFFGDQELSSDMLDTNKLISSSEKSSKSSKIESKADSFVVLQSNMDSLLQEKKLQPLNINPARITNPDPHNIPNYNKILEGQKRTESTQLIADKKQEMSQFKDKLKNCGSTISLNELSDDNDTSKNASSLLSVSQVPQYNSDNVTQVLSDQ